MRWRDRLVRALLRCYPLEFRDDYAVEVEQLVRDHARDGRAWRWSDLLVDVARTAPREHAVVLMNDLRYAVRLIIRAPMFSAAVVLTVALAIGANTAIFTVVNAVILRPLPFDQPQRLVQVAEKNDKLHLPNFSASLLNYLSWTEQARALDLAAYGFSTYSLSGQGEPEQFTGSPITPSLFRVLGLSPLVGRAFAAGDDRPGAAPVAMISEGLWKRRFGSDRSIVGQSLTLNSESYTIVGIAPPALAVLTGGDVWTPMTIDPGGEHRLNHVITVVGRMRPGVSLAQAQKEMDVISARVGEQYPEVRDWGINLVTFYRAFVNPQLETALVVLLCAVVCVLLIACANIANLLLARSAARQKEMAIRAAMGAGRVRLLRQLLVESVTLSVLGGIAGTLCAIWALPIVNRTLPPNLLPIPEIAIDRTVVLFAAAATIVTGLLFGIAPSWRAARLDLNATLKQSGRSAASGPRAVVRNLLAGSELALATVLLIGAALLIQTLYRLQRTELGFEPRGVLTFQLAPPAVKYPLDSKAPAFYRALIDSLEAIPGVRAAAVSSGLPFGAGNYTSTPITAVGPSVLPPDTGVPVDWRIVTPGYFHTMGIPLLRGRDFTDADRSNDARVVIISAATAERFWAKDDPIGRAFRQVADARAFTVIGVVGDVKNTALNRQTPAMYLAAARGVWPLMDVAVRTDADPAAILPSIRQAVRQLDPQLPLATVRTLDEWLSNSAAQPRLNAQLLGVFAAVALLIAAIGIYGVLAYSVTQRTREIGLRMALGAPRHRVLRLVISEGMAVGACGIGAGLVAAAAVGQTLSTLVFGIRVHDPLTYGGVAAVLAIVALAACFIPARRASLVDPLVALREE
jgi:putative ABC transport system permease protein